jgi:hypothetical protein
MAYNVWKTVAGAKAVDAPILSAAAAHHANPGEHRHEFQSRNHREERQLDDRAHGPDRERRRGLVEIVPLFFQRSTTEPVKGVAPTRRWQLTGRDIYMREGCYNCHSQMIRPVPRRDRALRPLLRGRRVRL